MNIQTALFPHKHVRFCDSLIGLAGFILNFLDEPRTVDEIMVLLAKNREKWPGHFSFSYTVLALDILYALKQIKLTNGDRVVRIS
jgi:hypothetical protein